MSIISWFRRSSRAFVSDNPWRAEVDRAFDTTRGSMPTAPGYFVYAARSVSGDRAPWGSRQITYLATDGSYWRSGPQDLGRWRLVGYGEKAALASAFYQIGWLNVGRPPRGFQGPEVAQR